MRRGAETKEYQNTLRLKLHLRKNHYYKAFVYYNFGTHQKSLDEQVRDDAGLGIPDLEYTQIQMVAAITS